MTTWEPDEPGAVTLPDGRTVIGRGLRDRGTAPDFALLLTSRPPTFAAPFRWVRWPDFLLPTDPRAAEDAILEAHARSRAQRVAVMCGRGTGRTGAALAVLAVMSGVPAADAVPWVRDAYRPRAVETPWQRRWVERTGRRLT